LVPKPVLKQYRGHLSAAQVAQGMNAAHANAVQLAEDAKFMLEAGRFPTAASLGVLSLEESGKPMILRRLLTCLTDKEVSEIWKSYRRHTEKNLLALVPQFAAKGAQTLGMLRPLFTTKTDIERMEIDVVKQLGFYTDCCGDKAHWHIPTDGIDKELATSLVSIALVMAHQKRKTTEQELNLWVSHMQSGMSRSNLLIWAAAMVEAGLEQPGYVEEMERFTQGV
jgi:AbiV family abortive infection protein